MYKKYEDEEDDATTYNNSDPQYVPKRKSTQAIELKTRLKVEDMEIERVKIKNMNERAAIMVDIMAASKDIAVESSNKLDIIEKNYDKTTKIAEKTEKVLEKTKEENTEEGGRFCYYLTILGSIVLVIILLSWISG